MNIFSKFLLSIIFSLIMLMQNQAQTIPSAKKIPKELKIHDDVRIDNYFWLRERENPEVIEYLEAENTYTDAKLKSTEALQEELYQEMIGRIKQTDESVPYLKNGYYFYTRYEEGKEYPIYCRKKGNLGAEEEILLNVNEMAEDYNYYSVRGLSVSNDDKLLAYFVDTVGRRKYTIRIKDLSTGETLEDQIPDATSFAWAADSKTIFAGTKDDNTLRADKIWKYELGGNFEQDATLVFEETDETFSTYVYSSKSKEYIFIYSGSTLSTEIQFLKADKINDNFQVFLPRERAHEYDISHYEDKFLIISNRDAKNFKLMETSVDNTTESNWKEVIPHREDVFLEGFEVFKNYLVLEERKEGLVQLRVKTWDKTQDYYIEFDDPTYLVYTTQNYEYNTDKLRFRYTSLTRPYTTYEFDMQSKERALLKEQEVLGGFDANNYTSERLYATARDGVKVPISLVYRKDMKTEGASPLLLYGYGSYGYSIDATFSSARLSLLDRGFVYAIAHIRGGQEMGRQWYEDGKMFKKKNTFYDFIDCAEFLIQEDYTQKEKLFAYGGSAGGLLMGAVINLRPDLFKGVIAAVPFVDVVSTMLDESIPLTTGEYDEWGNPNIKEQYEYILSYSPYDQIEEKDYPNLLVTTGLHDSQVQYWEPAKWVAKLREMKTDNNLLLLKTDMKAGHSGTTGRFKQYKETALKYAFLLYLLEENQ